MPDLLISGKNLALNIAGRSIIHDISISINAGEIVTVIGPNGAGKSTLIRILLGLQSPSAGRVSRKPGLRIAYVPQRFPLTSNVPLDVARLLTLTGHASKAEIDAVLEETGIVHLRAMPVASLSGGELQRALLAKALLRNPELLVLDEPVQAVDFIGEIKLYELIASIKARHGCGILMISHDLHMVMAESDRIICLNGHICCEGGPDRVQSDPEFARLFGPSAARMIAAYTHHHDHDHESHDHHKHRH